MAEAWTRSIPVLLEGEFLCVEFFCLKNREIKVKGDISYFIYYIFLFYSILLYVRLLWWEEYALHRSSGVYSKLCLYLQQYLSQVIYALYYSKVIFHLIKEAPFCLSGPATKRGWGGGWGKGRATKKKNFFEALKKIDEKIVATKLEGWVRL